MTGDKLTVEIHHEGHAFREWLKASGGRTHAEFQQEVVGRIAGLCEAHANVIRCLVFMPAEAVQVMIGTEPPYDFGLCERIAELEIDLTQKGWHYLEMVQSPMGGDLTDLRNFGRFCAESDDQGFIGDA